MTEFERKAMLGDKQAQEECTRKGIVLSCPFCGVQKIKIDSKKGTNFRFVNGKRKSTMLLRFDATSATQEG